MTATISARARAIQPSATMALATKAREMRAAGRDVLSLTAGEPDFATPEAIVASAYQAMQAGRTHYTAAGGIPELNQAIFEMLAEEGVELTGPQCVIPTPGAKQAVFYVCQALLDPGDKVLLPEPAWVSYVENIRLAGAEVVPVGMDPDQGWKLDPERIQAAAEEAGGAKMLMLNSPCNPTGRVFGPEEIEGIVEVANQLDLVVVSDEIYGRLVFGEHQFQRLAAHDGLKGRVVTIDGMSKAWAMTGWRLGWIAGDAEVVAACRKLQSHSATCPAEFTQVAGVTAIRECDAEVERMRAAFERRGQLVEQVFGKIPGIGVRPAEGAFYAFLDVREVCGGDEAAFCARMLEEAEVAMVPGRAFGEAGKGFLRMSFATSEDVLTQAAARLERFVGR